MHHKTVRKVIYLESMRVTWIIKTSLSTETCIHTYSNVWHQYGDDCQNLAGSSSLRVVLHSEFHAAVEGVLRFDLWISLALY